MKNQSRIFLVLLFLLAWLALPALAQDMRDQVEGSWISSSGTPITLTRGDNVQLVLLRINGGPAIECWLSGGRDGNTYLSYKAPDGTAMTGKLNEAAQKIEITSETGFKATWKRR